MRALRLALPVLALALAPALRAQEGTRLYDETFPVRAGDRLNIALSSEDVRVETGSGPATVTVYGRGRDAEEVFAERRFRADYRDGKLDIRTEAKQRGWGSNRSASFTVVVRVPARMDANVATASGDVRFARLDGKARIATSSGDVTLDEVTGPSVHVATSSGDVEGQRVQSAGAFNVATSSGDVSLREARAEEIAVATSSGDVQARAFSAQRIKVATSSGDVTVGRFSGAGELSTGSGDLDIGGIEGALKVSTGSGDVAAAFAKPGDVAVSTGSGSVSLALPRGVGADVRLSSGSIDIDRALDFRGERGRRSAEGRIGDGGVMMRVSTGSGSIELAAR